MLVTDLNILKTPQGGQLKHFFRLAPASVTSHLGKVKVGSELSHSVPIALFTCLEKIPWAEERDREGERWGEAKGV